jgi:hypothetical protein
VPRLGEDVLESLNSATRSLATFDVGLKDLRAAVSAGNWDGVEVVRAKLLAAVDSYVDHYSAAAKRLAHEGNVSGR